MYCLFVVKVETLKVLKGHFTKTDCYVATQEQHLTVVVLELIFTQHETDSLFCFVLQVPALASLATSLPVIFHKDTRRH